MKRNGENLEMVSRGVGNQHASIGGGQTGGEDLVLMFDAIDIGLLLVMMILEVICGICWS